MADEIKDGGGASTSTDSSGAESTQTEPIENKKTVPLENHKRALDDMHKFKTRAQELESKLNAVEEERLKETQNFKSLWEKSKAELDAEKKKRESLESNVTRSLKFNALHRAAVESGIRDEAIADLELLDITGVELETTDKGRYTVQGTKEYIENLKSTKPHWFKKDKPPVVNSGGGGAKPPAEGKLTASKVNELERMWKSGRATKEQYMDAHRRFVTQK